MRYVIEYGDEGEQREFKTLESALEFIRANIQDYMRLVIDAFYE